MKSSITLSIVLLGALAFTGAALSAADLGDPASKLRIAEWIKGKPVDLAAAKGKQFVVVEFWATWCGPCRTSIPHLTGMQKKFKNKGVVFVGVSDETADKVKPFVARMGDQMEYVVAIDDQSKTGEGYMEAYGINGIPHAFVVDKDGRMVWHGHPMAGLEEAIAALLGGTFDLAKEKKRAAAQRKLQDYFDLAMAGNDDAKLDEFGKELVALDRELDGIEPGAKFDPDKVKQAARFQRALSTYERSAMSGNDDAELDRLAKDVERTAPADFKVSDFIQHSKTQKLFQDYLKAVSTECNEIKAAALAQKLETLETKDAEALNHIAWALLTDKGIIKRDLPLALKIAKRAYDACDGKNASMVDTYARALFDCGNIKDAIAYQKKAIELCDDAGQKPEYEDTLKRYQAKAGPN